DVAQRLVLNLAGVVAGVLAREALAGVLGVLDDPLQDLGVLAFALVRRVGLLRARLRLVARPQLLRLVRVGLLRRRRGLLFLFQAHPRLPLPLRRGGRGPPGRRRGPGGGPRHRPPPLLPLPPPPP